MGRMVENSALALTILTQATLEMNHRQTLRLEFGKNQHSPSAPQDLASASGAVNVGESLGYPESKRGL